ncbi:hypothetical protein [uncultured Algoriphagus sp.]|uniref:hypothetical protein n=1 Tax=uncultured Algoriphagus sp. TaxID=417365 RepID=UPI0025985337|nr:hypothetical protein [uncultured Algoriphagus sp.]
MKKALDFIYNIYFEKSQRLPYFSLWDRLIQRVVNILLDIEMWLGISVKKKKTIPNLIVSLTSHSCRVKYVYKTVYSILRQDYNPEKIVLFLDMNFWNNQNIPKSVKRMINNKFEIVFVKDKGPHTVSFPKNRTV